MPLSKLSSLLGKSLARVGTWGWGLILFLALACTIPRVPVQTIRIELPSNAGPIAQRASEILAREITERSGAKIFREGKAGFTVELAVQPGIGTEGFTIANDGNGKVKITGNDENGLLYGVGKFLHTSRYGQGGFTPGTWRGTDVPKGTMRGIYFATHFNNWYEAASDEERQRYMESLALWGVNSLVVHYPNQWFSGIDDMKAHAWIKKMNRLMKNAKSVGMQIGLLQIANTGYTSTPKNLLATHNYQCWGNTICPSKPSGAKLLAKNWSELLDRFSGTGPGFVVYWPYDEGGCACNQCSPWGANGFPKMCEKLTTVLRQKYPEAKTILSTWLYDLDYRKPNGDFIFKFTTDGEYAGLDKYLNEHPGWADYIMSDAHEVFPEYPLKVGVPGNLPMVNFPEVSMYGQSPWGGYGANPFPRHLQDLWDPAKDKLMGGFPYSEGIYEDMNKVICSQFYWNPDQSATEIVKEYIAYEYSPSVVDSVARAVDLLEQNHLRRFVKENRYNPSGDWFQYGVVMGGTRIAFQDAENNPLTEQGKQGLEQRAQEALRLIEQADKQLTPQAKQAWRWRILYLRALIDRELVRTDGWFEGPVLKAAFEELTKISQCEQGSTGIHVPKIEDAGVKFSQQPDKY